MGRDQNNKYHDDRAPHTLDSWTHKKELTVSHQMPNTQDQNQTDRADIHVEGWCGTILQIVCSHATLIGGVHMKTFFEHETIHSLPLYPTEGNYSRESQVRSAHYSGTEDPPGTFDVKVVDGSAVVHFLSITNITTFNEYTPVVSLFPTSWHTWILPKELMWSGILPSPAA